MINTQVFLNNIVTAMTSLTWTSISGGGTSSFVNVFDYPNFISDSGSPFLCVVDVPQGGAEDETSDDYEFVTNIEFWICVRWANVDKSTEVLKRDEALTRLREGYDKLREYLASDSNIQAFTTGATRNGASNLTWRKSGITVRDENMSEANIYARVLTLPITDIISNN